MKKYINLSLCFIIALAFISCEEDEIREAPVNIGGYAYPSQRTITIFDTNENLNINFYTAQGVTAETVEILSGGTVLGNGTVSGETGSFSTSILGDLEADDSHSLRIRTTYSNGNVSEDPFTVVVHHAISTDDPTTATMDDYSTVELSYEVSTFAADVNDVTLSVKEGSKGTYQPTSIDLATDEGSVELGDIDLEGLDIDLAVNDTLYYKFTATSGTLIDAAESYVAIVPKAFSNSGSATLSDDPNADELDLASGDISASDGEITFLAPTGFAATDDSDITFVAVSNDFWSTADVITAREAYEAGDPVTSITSVSQGDVFVYKITREVEDDEGNLETLTYYGVIRVGDVSVVNDTAVSFDLDYMEGM